MPSHALRPFMEAVEKFETLANSSPELTAEFLNLERLATLYNLKLEDHLSNAALKQFSLMQATFGRSRPVLRDLCNSSWALDASAIVDAFGPQTLASFEFVKRLRKFASLDPPVPWNKAKAALDEASDRRLNNPGRGIPTCSWSPSDVTEAMKIIVQDATSTANTDNSHDGANHTRVDADTDDGHEDGHEDGLEDGLDDFGANYSDTGDDSDAHDVEYARGNVNDSALPDLSTLDADLSTLDTGLSTHDADLSTLDAGLDLTDSLVQQSAPHYSAVGCLSSPAPSAHSSEGEQGPVNHMKDPPPANTPLKRRRARSPEPDATELPPKHRHISRNFSSSRLAALGQKEIHLGKALGDGHVSVRRPHRHSILPSQELLNADASASKPTSLPGGFGRVNGDSDKGAAVVDTQCPWPPSHAAEVLQQLEPYQQLRHKTIWTIVELFLPPTQVRILDVPEPSAEQSWDLWASCNRLSRNETDSMLLFPLHLRKRKHWVLMCLDLDRCKATLFDSISDHATAQALGAAARAFVRALGLSWEDGSWRYHDNPKVPQQTNGYDCGVYVIISCIYCIARIDMPPDIDASHWRIALSFALDPRTKGFDLYTTPPVLDVPSAARNPLELKGLVEDVKVERIRCKNLVKATKRVEQMAHVLNGVYTRLRTSKSGSDEARQDVLVRQSALDEWNRLSQLHASDVKILQQIQETVKDARARLQRTEAKDKWLHVSTTILDQLYLWVEKQRVELHKSREEALQAEAKTMAAVREGRRLLDELLQD